MASEVSDWVWDHSRARNGGRLVLLAIARAADAEGEITMSVMELARLAGVSERTVQAAEKELAVLGELKVEHGGGRKRRNRYIVVTGNPADPAPRRSCTLSRPTAVIIAGQRGIRRKPRRICGVGNPRHVCK